MEPSCGSTRQAIASGALEGRNSMLRTGWTGCAPPRGDTAHRYVFQLFALDQPIDLGAHAGRSSLLRGLRGHVLQVATLTGVYER